jgi:hypothetical protein
MKGPRLATALLLTLAFLFTAQIHPHSTEFDSQAVSTSLKSQVDCASCAGFFQATAQTVFVSETTLVSFKNESVAFYLMGPTSFSRSSEIRGPPSL